MRRRPHLRARVRIPEPAGQVLWKTEVDAVVDRHDRAARRQRRQHVVRRVEQLDPFAPEIDRDRELLGHRIRRRAFDHRPEPPSQRLDGVTVVLLTEHDVFVRHVLPRELPQQIAHVGADAVIAQLARVDGYAHASFQPPASRCRLPAASFRLTALLSNGDTGEEVARRRGDACDRT